MSIYVETRIRGRLEDLWLHTQDPAHHERWDLRFSEISYCPREGDEPQRFRYETRIGFGLRIRGEGESTGTREGDSGARTSALRFWSGDPKSLIGEGSGYWRYIPTADGVRFLTWYDYRTRFGAPGRVIDRMLLRPLMGWATAWSFDRLRLWIEQGIDPALSLERSVIHAVVRLSLAAVFLYQAIVPKLVYRHASELQLLTGSGLPAAAADRWLLGIGIAELALGAALLFAWRWRWPFAVIIALMPVALVGVAVFSPAVLIAAFNPVALNVAVAALAGVGWLTSTDLPSAARCLRTRPDQRPGEAA